MAGFLSQNQINKINSLSDILHTTFARTITDYKNKKNTGRVPRNFFYALLELINKRQFQMSDNNQPRFGFVNYAETWNGRLAMVGILIGLSTELLTGQGILGQIGLG